MKAIRQEHGLWCAVACIRHLLLARVSYKETLLLFENGEYRVDNEANHYFRELFSILGKFGKKYKWQYAQNCDSVQLNKKFSIVFIAQSPSYLLGHFVRRYMNKGMDPWINFPDRNYKQDSEMICQVKLSMVVMKCYYGFDLNINLDNMLVWKGEKLYWQLI